MFKIKTLNKIDSRGLDFFDDKYSIVDNDEVDAIILRSYKMHEYKFEETIKCIGRAGAGVNNIPIDTCTKKGIVVFNTPGANANGVKECVLTGMLLSCRDIVGSIKWLENADTQKEGVSKTVESNKSNFKGDEIKGKTLGVVGLGAIGILVADMAISLGMKVIGYDPYLSVENAKNLNPEVELEGDVEKLYPRCDFITLHLPLLDSTRGFIDSSSFEKMKDGIRILNFARDGLINEKDLKLAIENGKVRKYVTDFPNEDVMNMKNTILIPHLGASTEESETNCAIMAVKEIKDFLENGNVKNSVNLPECGLGIAKSKHRLTVLGGKDIKKELSSLTEFCNDSIEKTRNDVYYGIFDYENEIDEELVKKIEGIGNVTKVRVI